MTADRIYFPFLFSLCPSSLGQDIIKGSIISYSFIYFYGIVVTGHIHTTNYMDPYTTLTVMVSPEETRGKFVSLLKVADHKDQEFQASLKNDSSQDSPCLA